MSLVDRSVLKPHWLSSRTFSEIFLSVEEDFGKYFPCYGQEGNTAVVSTVATISFLFVYCDYEGILEILWQFLLFPTGVVQ